MTSDLPTDSNGPVNSPEAVKPAPAGEQAPATEPTQAGEASDAGQANPRTIASRSRKARHHRFKTAHGPKANLNVAVPDPLATGTIRPNVPKDTQPAKDEVASPPAPLPDGAPPWAKDALRTFSPPADPVVTPISETKTRHKRRHSRHQDF